MQAINEEAKQGGAEGATLPQPHGGGLAVPSDSIDPHGTPKTPKTTALTAQLHIQLGVQWCKVLEAGCSLLV